MTATEEARDLALLAAAAASDKLATDIVLIDVSERLAITDVFLIASGSNERQVEAIVDAVEEKLRAADRKPLRREGRRDGRWVLLDYADIVIHIQHTEERVFYALERLWKDCAMISIDPRGGGSTEWVQPSAARTADRAAAGAAEVSLAPATGGGVSARLEQADDEFEDDEFDGLTDADAIDLEGDDELADDELADDDLDDDGLDDDGLDDDELDDDELDDDDAVADVDLTGDDPADGGELADGDAANADAVELGRRGWA